MIVIKLGRNRYHRVLAVCAWVWGEDASEADLNPSEYLRAAASHLVRL